MLGEAVGVAAGGLGGMAASADVDWENPEKSAGGSRPLTLRSS